MRDIKLVTASLLILLITGLGVSYMIDVLDKTIDDIMERQRSENSPTKYEYKVLSVEKGSTFVFNEVYYEVTYIGADDLLITQHFETKNKLHLVISNESKLVIENPEPNGYPPRYTLYWEFT